MFALIGRADPDPKGFAWLATMVGLFETGYITSTGFFADDVRERKMQAPGMGTAARRRHPARQGRRRAATAPICSTSTSTRSPARDVDDVRALLHLPPKSADAIAAGSVGLSDPAGDVGASAGSVRATPRRLTRAGFQSAATQGIVCAGASGLQFAA